MDYKNIKLDARDYLAVKILNGILASGRRITTPQHKEEAVETAYEYAEEMLKRKSKN